MLSATPQSSSAVSHSSEVQCGQPLLIGVVLSAAPQRCSAVSRSSEVRCYQMAQLRFYFVIEFKKASNNREDSHLRQGLLLAAASRL